MAKRNCSDTEQSYHLNLDDHLRDAVRHLNNVSPKWKKIGLELKVKPSVLKKIRSQYSDPDERLEEMLSEWLSGINPYPTWEKLAQALESRRVNESQLAEEVRKSFIMAPTQAIMSPVSMNHSPAQRSSLHASLPPYAPAPHVHPVDQYADYLRSCYESEKLPAHSKWPPTTSKKYINLAVVKKKPISKREANEFTRATLHGNIDDIMWKKGPLKFSQVGIKEDGSHARLILVEGAPGIGKTTFAWKLGRKWSKNKILRCYRLVVLLRLRDKRVREAKTIYDLLYYSDNEVRREVEKELIRKNGKSVLLLFEGFDELPRKLQTQTSIFLDILCREKLPKATVLITSRPSATQFLHSKFKSNIDQHIEILGFTEADVQSYVQSVIDDKQFHTEFLQYLKCYPHIKGLMYVPLNAVIVTELYKTAKLNESQEFAPTTLTELYTSLTRSMLLRYLKSHSEYSEKEWRLSSFSDLPEELYAQFHTICRIAFQGILKDEFIFDDLLHDFKTLDLMQSAPELYVDEGAVLSYNFFHVTLQEFLAAVHLSQQPTQEQLQCFVQRARKDFEIQQKSDEIEEHEQEQAIESESSHSSIPLSKYEADIIDDFIQSITPKEPLVTVLPDAATPRQSGGVQNPIVLPKQPHQAQYYTNQANDNKRL